MTKTGQVFSIGLAIISSISLQGQTFVVSNLGQTPPGIWEVVDSGNWRATSFTTGSEATTLQGLVTRIASFDGSDQDESVALYDNSASNMPGSSVVSFLDNPQDLGSDGRFRFSYDGTYELAADTTYWVVFEVDGGTDFDFEVFSTLSTSETGDAGWSIGDTPLLSGDLGSSWSSASRPMQFGIEIIPEPSGYAFAIGIGLIAFITFRRRKLPIKCKGHF